MQAVEIIKNYLGPEADAAEVELYTSVKTRTLYRWYTEKPQLFTSTVIGAASIKKVLNLSEHEKQRKLIEIRTREFTENGGHIEVVAAVYQPENVPPKAKPWGQELPEG